jgi:hypothetical protein
MMPKLSEKRRDAVYKAVFDTINDMRVDLRLRIRHMTHDEVDFAIAQAINKVYDAVIAAAEGRDRP